jgi:hypothetical protein
MVKRFVLLIVLLFMIVVGCEAPYGYLGEEPTASCSRQCLQAPPLGFDGPVLLWAGDPAEVPACPEQAPEIVFEGYEGLNNAPVECAPCACSQPKCKLPAGIALSTAYGCPDDGDRGFLPAPASWDGSCVAPSPPYPDPAMSVGQAPPTEEPCAPVVETPEITALGPPFTIRARACGAEGKPYRCHVPGRTCSPNDQPPPPGFRRCLLSLIPDGASCPAEYPDEVAFFAELTDHRGCAPCTCTQTAQSECRVMTRTYQDKGCSYPFWGVQNALGGGWLCAFNPDQFPVRSFGASWLTNAPGSCTAGGGAPTGEVTLEGRQSFCCEEPAVRAEGDEG